MYAQVDPARRGALDNLVALPVPLSSTRSVSKKSSCAMRSPSSLQPLREDCGVLVNALRNAAQSLRVRDRPRTCSR